MPFEDNAHIHTPPDETVIWRYLDFTKFVSALEHSAFFFPGLQTLSQVDQFEGSLSVPTLDEFRIPLSQSDSNQTTERFDAFINIFRGMRTALYANCWHANAYGSAAMWGLSLRHGDGVAIKSTVGRLKAAFAVTTEPIHIGSVKYIDFQTERVPWQNVFHIAFHKRRSFEYEREVRAVVYGDYGPRGTNIDVDLNALISAIHVAPTSPAWLHELLSLVCARYSVHARY